jgi:putative colanic acid biosysnthesis UDP-glucose lipid carrier transferase
MEQTQWSGIRKMPTSRGVISSNHKTVDFFSRLLDMLVLTLCLFVTYDILNKTWSDLTSLHLLLAFIYFQLFAALTGMYGSQRSMTLWQQYGQVTLTLIGTFTFLALTAYISHRFADVAGRKRMILWFLTSTVALCGTRLIIRSLLGWLRKQGFNTRCAAIVGTGPLGLGLAEKFASNPWMGIRVGGFYDENPNVEADGIVVRGNLDTLLKDASAGVYENIYIALPLASQEKIRHLTDQLSDTAASVYFVPDVFIFDLMNARHASIDGIPAISIYDTPFSVMDNIVKRGFDIFGSGIILTLISPLMLTIALAVRLTSPGPAIFKQKRYGLDGKPIQVWKFRTMCTMDNGSVVKQATQNDSRLTSIGGFLRRTSLDELPQFINVLQGSMSIVGPRPHAVAHNEQYRKVIKGYMLRHKVKPGITGWAQINGWRGETDTLEKMQKRVEFDLHYIRNWNIWLDVKIVFLTIFKGFISKNAY